MQVSIENLAKWLKTRDDFILIGHVSPDGDAAGSCMAACLALRALGKRAFVCLPGGVPKVYLRYPDAGSILKPGDPMPFQPKTGFSLDVSEPQRLGEAQSLFDACGEHAMLDHHATNPGFGEVWHVDGGRIAAGELVLELIEALGVTLTKDMATWLFVAISTDSGHFRFAGTSPTTMRAAAKLLEAGVDVAKVTRELWYTRSLARTRLMGAVLSGLEVSEDGTMAWSRLTDRMLEENHALREDNDGIINYLLDIDGVEFAALAEERPEGTKFSLRAKEWLNVAEDVAKPFGGGGHAFAAGCTLNLPMEEALKKVLQQARMAMENHQ